MNGGLPMLVDGHMHLENGPLTKEYVMELIEEDLDEPLTFKRYPKSDMYLIALRNKVNKEIARLSSAS